MTEKEDFGGNNNNAEWSNDLIVYLNNPYYFSSYFKNRVRTIAAMKGLAVEINNGALEYSFNEWRRAYASWVAELTGIAEGPVRRVSHIKGCGALLWALTQCGVATVRRAWPLRPEDAVELQAAGVDPGVITLDNPGRTYQRYPNEALTFIFVQTLFNAIQYNRGLPMRYDATQPPMTQHFLHNMCYFLENCAPTKEGLYMIFKMADLYGLHHGEEA